MYNSSKILAIIPARAGSKGIPLKNITLVNKKPLIYYTIKAALKCKLIDLTIVSTDSIKIAEISKKYGAVVPFIRPKNLARDTSSSEEVILHALNWLQKYKSLNFDIFILLQPTSPLRNSQHIREAIELFYKNEKANTLYSVTEVKQIPYKMMRLKKDGYLERFIKTKISLKRRQDFQKLYYPNGAIYISKVDIFLRNRKFDEKRLIPYMMDTLSSLDIDDEFDLLIAERTISEKNVY